MRGRQAEERGGKTRRDHELGSLCRALCDADFWRHRTSTSFSFLIFYTLRLVKALDLLRRRPPGPVFVFPGRFRDRGCCLDGHAISSLFNISIPLPKLRVSTENVRFNWEAHPCCRRNGCLERFCQRTGDNLRGKVHRCCSVDVARGCLVIIEQSQRGDKERTPEGAFEGVDSSWKLVDLFKGSG